MRPGDRIRASCDIYDRACEQLLVPTATEGTVDHISMFGRSALVDYDNGMCVRQRARHCRKT